MSSEDARQQNSADARYRKTGRAVARLGDRFVTDHASGWELMGLSIRKPRDEGEDFLITLRALDADGQPQVTFSGSAFLDDALVTLFNRLENGSLKWREDKYGR